MPPRRDFHDRPGRARRGRRDRVSRPPGRSLAGRPPRRLRHRFASWSSAPPRSAARSPGGSRSTTSAAPPWALPTTPGAASTCRRRSRCRRRARRSAGTGQPGRAAPRCTGRPATRRRSRYVSCCASWRQAHRPHARRAAWRHKASDRPPPACSPASAARGPWRRRAPVRSEEPGHSVCRWASPPNRPGGAPRCRSRGGPEPPPLFTVSVTARETVAPSSTRAVGRCARAQAKA